MRKGKRKLNQAGMSLVELVVVILIIGILSATAGVGISFFNRMNATSAAEKLASALERARVLTISADRSVKLVLEKVDNEYYAVVKEAGVETDRVKIGNTALDIKVDGVLLTDTSNESDFTFEYKKSNGSFEGDKAKVVIEGNQTKTVYLVKATGRCYIE